ncbi:MAG: pyrroline-5-carboxylate reductase [Clostridium sp.]|uniref:pyrroline-5-carboxylate reductase n=1 Tax=Clostridium sp. TaxID=1506 RepID=UPI001EC09C65|nr:pyrroline-5-carboxylate reductase [Clostridium sp.]MBS5886564.1 pyrroline-5-carboxylate reductase [Clostridium sp.]MDU7150061.1 pyrroline-5-carboxylate reductase [Clostridium sp.]
MNKKIGFIGCGNMGKAMLNGLINSNYTNVDNIMVSTKSEESKNNIIDEFKVKCILDNIEVAKFSDILFLAIKPNMYKKVINEIKENLKKDIIIVSIAAGINLSDLEEWLDKDYKIVKTMPNTPALVGEGMSAICPNLNVNKEELRLICNIFKNFGKYEILEEKYFDGFIALCGSSPAYVFMFIEAMADAAVKLGIPRNKAYKMAEQSILGSAKLALDTGKHPAELKDMVCSPGGTTIEAVTELESNGFRNAVIKAMEKCAEKSKNIQ